MNETILDVVYNVDDCVDKIAFTGASLRPWRCSDQPDPEGSKEASHWWNVLEVADRHHHDAWLRIRWRNWQHQCMGLTRLQRGRLGVHLVRYLAVKDWRLAENCSAAVRRLSAICGTPSRQAGVSTLSVKPQKPPGSSR